MRPHIHLFTIVLLALGCGAASAPAGVRERITADAAGGRPLVAHVVVALCDNEHQGIVRVPAHLGNGQDPASNLYWGAAYGVRTFLTREAGWRVATRPASPRPEVRESLVLRTRTTDGRELFLVAEAWDGREMAGALARFLRLAAGWDPETVAVADTGRVRQIEAGGASHLIAFVGHNGLMDGAAREIPPANPDAQERSSVVLACVSEPYFAGLLSAGGSTPLLLTTGLMAPEAYTLDAVVRAWFGGGDEDEVCAAAARAYDRYQHCGVTAARNLFGCGR